MGSLSNRCTYWRRYVVPDFFRGLALFLVCAILVLAVILLLMHAGGPVPDDCPNLASRTGC